MNWIMIVSWVVVFILGIVFYSNPDNYSNAISGKIWELICCFFTSLFLSIVVGTIIGGFIEIKRK